MWSSEAKNWVCSSRREWALTGGHGLSDLGRFYTYIPGKPPVHPNPRTFIILPQAKSPYEKYFVAAHNRLAVDEVGAHTSMFQSTSNDGYYELGLHTAQAIRDAVVLTRGTGV